MDLPLIQYNESCDAEINSKDKFRPSYGKCTSAQRGTISVNDCIIQIWHAHFFEKKNFDQKVFTLTLRIRLSPRTAPHLTRSSNVGFSIESDIFSGSLKLVYDESA